MMCSCCLACESRAHTTRALYPFGNGVTNNHGAIRFSSSQGFESLRPHQARDESFLSIVYKLTLGLSFFIFISLFGL